MTGQQRVSIVTGGARGIGAAICDALARDSWAIAVWDLDLDAARERAAALTAAHGVAAHAVRVDISSVEQVNAAVAEVEAHLGPPPSRRSKLTSDRSKRSSTTPAST